VQFFANQIPIHAQAHSAAMIVVADTTPINYLVPIGYPFVLRDLFQQVILSPRRSSRIAVPSGARRDSSVVCVIAGLVNCSR
jgi:hypothetical protein